MSGIIGSKTTTNGLVLYVDAANHNSYTNGSTWYDLKGNANIQLNGPTLNNGAMLFNGIDDYATGGVTAGNLIVAVSTVSCWVKFNGLNIFAGLVSKDNTSFVFTLRLDISESRIELMADGDNVSILTDPVETGRWYYVNAVIEAYNYKLYLDGQLVGTNTIRGMTTNNDPLVIGSDYDYTRLLNGYIGLVTVHNRELTQEEITNNYNALKGRFGL